MRVSNHATLALALLALAAPAAAQKPQPFKRPAPAAPAATQQSKLSPEQGTAMSSVWLHTDLWTRLGDLAAQRGSNEEVKSFGRSTANDYRYLAKQLGQFLTARGANPATLPQDPDRQRLEQEMGQLSARSGEDFDRELLSFLKRNGPGFVDALKSAREATPGEDAELKKFLDGAEDVEEAHLTGARQLEGKRQARTPPQR